MNVALEATELRVHVLSERDDFAALAEQWRALCKQSSASFFMSWDWHYTWWSVYSTPRDKLHIVTFMKNDELVGVLPMYTRRSSFDLWPTLYFLGTGEAREDEVATEYLDIIAHTDHQDEVADAAVSWISSCISWGAAELRFMLDDALLVNAYRQRDDLHIIERAVGHRYRVDLAQSETAHLGQISAGRVKRIERSRRALAKAGALTQASINERSELDQAFQQLTELNHERQEKKQRKSVFASDLFRSFHRQLIDNVHASGNGNIHQFKLGSRLMAVLYCFYDQDTCYYYQSGFSRKDGNRYMPLTFAHLSEIQRNREAGRRYYDLMRAESPSYKEDFGCEATPMVSCFMFCSNSRRKRFQVMREARRQLVSGLSIIGIKRRR